MPSFHKDKNSGLWSCRFREVDLETGKTRQPRLSGFKTKKEAQYAYEDYITEYAEKKKAREEIKPSVHDDLSFTLLVLNYEKFKQQRIKESTYYTTVRKIADKILPFFRDYKVKEITPLIILDWQSTLKDYSYAYQKNLNTILSSIFSFGEKYYELPNVMRTVDRPRNTQGKKKMLFYTPEEFSKFIAEVENRTYNMFFKFLYLTGVRKGEALALTWEDIDLSRGTVAVEKTLSYKVLGDAPYVITPPKTVTSTRNLRLPSFFCTELKEYKKWQRSNSPPSDFVFGGNRPLPLTTIERYATNAADAAGVKRIRIHDFRHSYASYVLSCGVSIVALSTSLGHASSKETLDTYSHMLPNDYDVLLKALENHSQYLS